MSTESTAALLSNNAADFFSGARCAGDSTRIPRWHAKNGHRCAIRITAGAGALVELLEHSDASRSDEAVYASRPMVSDIAEAAAWIDECEAAWMTEQNALAAK